MKHRQLPLAAVILAVAAYPPIQPIPKPKPKDPEPEPATPPKPDPTNFTGPVGGGYAFNHDLTGRDRWDMTPDETHW